VADEGNEAAETRLAELALERDDLDDLDELRRVADDGNEQAEARLTEIIRRLGSR
jgi:hypothetical protein